MKLSRAQIFVGISTLAAPLLSSFGQISIGDSYHINFVDIDGNTLSTANGHITTVVVISQANVDKARTVGDRTPDFCLGNPKYQMITVLALQKNHSKPVRMILSSLVRRRLDAEARRLQSRYDQLKIARAARQDVFAVADFDGAVSKQLGAEPKPDLFRVFVFGKNGELLEQWSDPPSAEELATVLKRD
ncbi:MAG TPA: hypothetical protein VKE30_02930 [Chthoniobacterales bacterium]|nr:hypothetical protein [Chthoniobacterales bacterium]